MRRRLALPHRAGRGRVPIAWRHPAAERAKLLVAITAVEHQGKFFFCSRGCRQEVYESQLPEPAQA